ncbi:hypothetical protein HBI56_118280 [Parastagonospora nodorum]|uniref:Uncharacterized protein n=1 Tax=Phaeosphaeria nodorum (strain SN15 / ATCC MYA-4574 / FGSC 10173) TaxID=321614 RepID=A0A7U2I3Y7_PHANO|nr:hypothetical protein HBH56_056490 [Parastagonospora nodorum]QRD02481.1 hypothetical protein JI435_418080 [Parastagonospora nodorum SN15]KAH3921114.1 hypothetical protein HBH54_245760 [Parastagonospora nodorum]KAH3948503.1 hypothetical protein HBH53_097030 [Parastagonospora nodorum]KAH3956445.1 hypothetical protein HBH51_242160 [Parastagonospora nodorum]
MSAAIKLWPKTFLRIRVAFALGWVHFGRNPGFAYVENQIHAGKSCTVCTSKAVCGVSVACGFLRTGNWLGRTSSARCRSLAAVRLGITA